jgi:hypothetical protein
MGNGRKAGRLVLQGLFWEHRIFAKKLSEAIINGKAAHN